MSNLPDDQSRKATISNWHGWKLLVATVSLSVVIVVAIWAWHDRPASPPPAAPPLGNEVVVIKRALPMPPDFDKRFVGIAHLKGIPVYRIQTSEYGDEMIVDLASGKLVAVRDFQGKTIWGQPMARSPMTMADPPVKGS
jgi:hypothetical protein